MSENIWRTDCLNLGHQGENGARELKVYVTDWLAEYPTATIRLQILRPGEDVPYYVTGATVTGGVLTWIPSSADTGFGGYGKAELQAVQGETIVKSAVVKTFTEPCLPGTAGEVPPSMKPWTDAIEEAIEDIGGKLDAPETAGTAGQVLKLNADLEPVWGNGGGGSDLPEGGSAGDVLMKTADGLEWSDDVTDLKSAITGKQAAPATAGTAGQVLGLDSNLAPVWVNQSGGVDPSDIAEAVDAWCDENITNPGSPPLDRSLTASSAAAPADLVGVINDELSIETIPSKNLNKTTYPDSYTTKGVTFTHNSDGSFTLSGTPTGDIYWPARDASIMFLLPAGTYTLSGGRLGMSVDAVMYVNKTDTSAAMTKSAGKTNVTFTTEVDYWCFVRFTILSSAAPDGLTFYPQLEAGNEATEYQNPDYVEYKSEVLEDIREDIGALEIVVPDLSDRVDSVTRYEVGKNLANPATRTVGAVQSDGTVSTEGAWANYSTTDYIELEEDTDYVFACFSSTSLAHVSDRCGLLLYDAAKAPITNSYQNVESADYLSIDSGSTAKYARVFGKTSYLFQVEKGSSYTNFEAYSGKNVSALPLGAAPMAQAQEGNVLYKKKWAVCGDSFTDGATDTKIQEAGKYNGYRYVYPYLIGNRNEMEICKFFNGGETLAFPAEPGTFTNSLTNPSNVRYYQNIPIDADYITIYLGINDNNHATGSSQDEEDTTGVIPIGEITDNTTATYYGAWNVVLTWLITNRPHAHIGIIVTNGISSTEAYRQAQIAIAKKYGIPYIDMNGDARTPSMHRTCNPDIASAVKEALLAKWSVSESNSHPNDAAHLFESTFIENFLRAL